MDVDVVRASAIHLAGMDEGIEFQRALSGSGLEFRAIPSIKRSDPATSWAAGDKDNRVIVDLLVPQNKRKPFSAVSIPELSAAGTALPYMAYLVAETRPALVIGKSQLVPVSIPTPERFFWHKLVIAQDRPPSQLDKKRKDLAQAACIATAMASDPARIVVSWDDLSASMKKKAKASLALSLHEYRSDPSGIAALIGAVAGLGRESLASSKPGEANQVFARRMTGA
jgi:hypothetical protein